MQHRIIILYYKIFTVGGRSTTRTSNRSSTPSPIGASLAVNSLAGAVVFSTAARTPAGLSANGRARLMIIIMKSRKRAHKITSPSSRRSLTSRVLVSARRLAYCIHSHRWHRDASHRIGSGTKLLGGLTLPSMMMQCLPNCARFGARLSAESNPKASRAAATG